MKKIIPFNKPCYSGNEIKNVLKAIRSGCLAGDGIFTQLCENEIAKIVGCRKVLLTSSGTDALEIAALLCNIRNGDEFILPSFTYPSTANAFCLRGARPVFVDVRSDDLNLDVNLIEDNLTPATRVIIPAHYAGVPCDMDGLETLKIKYNLKIVEDAANAFLSTYKGRCVGTIGDFGCFSFHETKPITCGEGGAISINREEDVVRALAIRDKGTNRSAFLRGQVDKYSWVELGSSFLPSDLVAAVLHAQLIARDKILQKRQSIWKYYLKALSPLIDKELIQVGTNKGSKANCQMFYFLVNDKGIRIRLISYLLQIGVTPTFHYTPLHQSPFAKKIGIRVKLPVTESVSERIVRLPFYNSITMKEQNYIIEKILKFFEF